LVVETSGVEKVMTETIASAISVQAADFDPGLEIAQLGDGGEVGAVASFVGLVRGAVNKSVAGENAAAADSDIAALELEHYPGMTEHSIAEIVAQAEQRWSLSNVRVIHRIGRLNVGDRIVFVGAASKHRGDAFAACEFIMDYLKSRAPFWKKEWTRQGQPHWVDARESDQRAAARWS
jgi:molybdopterin synthase catalytic subunit